MKKYTLKLSEFEILTDIVLCSRYRHIFEVAQLGLKLLKTTVQTSKFMTLHRVEAASYGASLKQTKKYKRLKDKGISFQISKPEAISISTVLFDLNDEEYLRETGLNLFRDKLAKDFS
jgi:hypothetical protein